MRQLRPLLAALLAAMTIGSCAEAPTGPGSPIPGALLLRWTSPNTDDRAAVLKLVLPSGLAPGAATATLDGVEVFQRASADTLRLAVFGSLDSGTIILTLEVADVRQWASIRATVIEVAAEDDALRESLVGYALTIARE